jgi:hypothetical protein
MLRHKALLAGLASAAVIGLICISQAVSQQAGGPGGGRGGRGGGRSFDPAQMRQQMLDRMKENLGATDEEWKALAPKVEKVMTLSREGRGGMGFGMGGPGGRRGGRGAASQPAAEPPVPQTETGKAALALQTVLDNKDAKPAEIKTALKGLRDARAKAKTDLEAAQKELREVVTVRQEAILVVDGLLD